MKPLRTGADRESRFAASLPASMQYESGDAPCRAHNLSRTGVLLVGDLPIPASPVVRVTIGSPGRDLSVTLFGRISWSDREAESRETRLAVEFLGGPDDTDATLEALIARVVEGTSPASLKDLPDNASPEQVRAALANIPVPHRVTMAVRAMPKERGFLLRDTNVHVMDALARNPNLLPHELLKILRVRSILPHTLEIIAKDKRWANNEHILILVATNRNTPAAVAERLVSTMRKATLHKVIRAPDLAPALRTKVLLLLGTP
jgi:hypothetical protein